MRWRTLASLVQYFEAKNAHVGLIFNGRYINDAPGIQNNALDVPPSVPRSFENQSELSRLPFCIGQVSVTHIGGAFHEHPEPFSFRAPRAYRQIFL